MIGKLPNEKADTADDAGESVYEAGTRLLNRRAQVQEAKRKGQPCLGTRIHPAIVK